MGINSFLRQLNDAVDRTHLKEFAGQTLLVDALSWLHKACYGCAYELSIGRDTDKYIQYMLRKVDMLRSYGVAEVILVFDGQRLPLKSSTQEKRQTYKEENRKRALQAMADSKRLQGSEREDELHKAYQLFQRSVNISPAIIFNVMNALRAAQIPFVVAPFEADAQMAWMCKEKLAAGIVTEDSDVVVYCLTANVCSPVLVKLEENGYVQAVSRLILHKNSAKASSNALMRKIHYLTSGEKEATRMFVQVCVLAGCDFLDSLPNIGFATAVKHIYNFRGAPASLRVHRLVSKLSSSGTKIPTGFMQQFLNAEAIFYHHIVFNSTARSCDFLVNMGHENCFPDILQRAKESLCIASQERALPLVAEPDNLHSVVNSTKSFLGQIRSREVVEQIYKGEVCARTLCSLVKDTTILQNLQFDEAPPEHQKPLNTRLNGKETPIDISKTKHRISITKQMANKSSPVGKAEQIAYKKRLQAKECTVSIQGLKNAYRSAAQTKEFSKVDDWHRKNEKRIGILSRTSAVSKLTSVTATPFNDLVMECSHSVKAPISTDGIASKIVQSPRSKKRPRSSSKFAAIRESRTLKKTALIGKKTLFDFFRKVEDKC
ncbi:putative XPG/Rad2 endonuclease, PIN-like domain superfamily, 5'-3' exonuclease domain superfamily [Plasmopara halstedii]